MLLDEARYLAFVKKQEAVYEALPELKKDQIDQDLATHKTFVLPCENCHFRISFASYVRPCATIKRLLHLVVGRCDPHTSSSSSQKNDVLVTRKRPYQPPLLMSHEEEESTRPMQRPRQETGLLIGLLSHRTTVVQNSLFEHAFTATLRDMDLLEEYPWLYNSDQIAEFEQQTPHTSLFGTRYLIMRPVRVAATELTSGILRIALEGGEQLRLLAASVTLTKVEGSLESLSVRTDDAYGGLTPQFSERSRSDLSDDAISVSVNVMGFSAIEVRCREGSHATLELRRTPNVWKESEVSRLALAAPNIEFLNVEATKLRIYSHISHRSRYRGVSYIGPTFWTPRSHEDLERSLHQSLGFQSERQRHVILERQHAMVTWLWSRYVDLDSNLCAKTFPNERLEPCYVLTDTSRQRLSFIMDHRWVATFTLTPTLENQSPVCYLTFDTTAILPLDEEVLLVRYGSLEYRIPASFRPFLVPQKPKRDLISVGQIVQLAIYTAERDSSSTHVRIPPLSESANDLLGNCEPDLLTRALYGSAILTYEAAARLDLSNPKPLSVNQPTIRWLIKKVTDTTVQLPGYEYMLAAHNHREVPRTVELSVVQGQKPYPLFEILDASMFAEDWNYARLETLQESLTASGIASLDWARKQELQPCVMLYTTDKMQHRMLNYCNLLLTITLVTRLAVQVPRLASLSAEQITTADRFLLADPENTGLDMYPQAFNGLLPYMLPDLSIVIRPDPGAQLCPACGIATRPFCARPTDRHTGYHNPRNCVLFLEMSNTEEIVVRFLQERLVEVHADEGLTEYQRDQALESLSVFLNEDQTKLAVNPDSNTYVYLEARRDFYHRLCGQFDQVFCPGSCLSRGGRPRHTPLQTAIGAWGIDVLPHPAFEHRVPSMTDWPSLLFQSRGSDPSRAIQQAFLQRDTRTGQLQWPERCFTNTIMS